MGQSLPKTRRAPGSAQILPRKCLRPVLLTHTVRPVDKMLYLRAGSVIGLHGGRHAQRCKARSVVRVEQLDMFDAVTAVPPTIGALRGGEAIQRAAHRRVADGVNRDLEPQAVCFHRIGGESLRRPKCIAHALRAIGVGRQHEGREGLDDAVHKELDRTGPHHAGAIAVAQGRGFIREGCQRRLRAHAIGQVDAAE